MKLYIAGPMTGIPQFNFPAFEQAAKDIRSWGYEVISPHEEDSEESRKLAWASPDGAPFPPGVGDTWGTCLARDVKFVADEVDGIAFLPRWRHSKGARLEAMVGLLTGKKFWQYYPPTTDERSFLLQYNTADIKHYLKESL